MLQFAIAENDAEFYILHSLKPHPYLVTSCLLITSICTANAYYVPGKNEEKNGEPKTVDSHKVSSKTFFKKDDAWFVCQHTQLVILTNHYP